MRKRDSAERSESTTGGGTFKLRPQGIEGQSQKELMGELSCQRKNKGKGHEVATGLRVAGAVAAEMRQGA